MKKKDIQELRNQQPGELENVVREGRDRVRALRFDLAAGKVKNVNDLREARKKIARAKTFLKQQSQSAQ